MPTFRIKGKIYHLIGSFKNTLKTLILDLINEMPIL